MFRINDIIERTNEKIDFAKQEGEKKAVNELIKERNTYKFLNTRLMDLAENYNIKSSENKTED